MSKSTTYITNMGLAIREELSDIITNIAPTETPFISNIKKGKVKNRFVEWLTDTLAPAANNAQLEGASANPAPIAAPTRVGNRTQISAKWFDISDTMDVVDSAGGLTTVEYQTAKHLKELARDIEFALINNTTDNAGGTGTPRQARGLKGWITTNTFNFGGAQAVTNILTEDHIRTRMQVAWGLGGNVDMILTTGAQKRRISDFNQSNRITVTAEAGDKKIVSVVDYYECDFGVVRVYPDRFIAPDATNYDWLFGLQKDKWEFATLIPVKVEKLARTGLSQLVQISTEYTLISWAENANFRISNLYNL